MAKWNFWCFPRDMHMKLEQTNLPSFDVGNPLESTYSNNAERSSGHDENTGKASMRYY